MSEAQDDTGIQELDNSTDSFVEVQAVDEPEASPASKHSGVSMEGGEDIVVLDNVSEPDKEDTSGFGDERHISTTSEDVLGGIAGEGAELHPEFDDFEDDQQFEVLETADCDLSEGQESSEVEQSPSGSSSVTDKERGKDSGREKSSSERSGDKSRSKESDSHSSRSRAKAGEGSTASKGRRERSKERKSSSEAASSSASPSGSSTGKKDEKDKRPISPIVFGSQKDSRDKEREHDKSGSKSSRDKSKSNSGPHRIVDKLFSNTRYFVIKSNNYENVQIAKDRNVWSTPPYNEKKLNKAYKDCRNVILIFSVRESGRFQGIARLMTESRHDGHHVPWVLPPGISQSQLGGVFKLDWLHKGSLEFSVCMDLKNPWNDNKPVKISRDGQEVEPTVGEKLCRLWQKIESDDDVLSGRDQRAGPSGGSGGAQTGSSSGSGSSSIPHSGGHMPHFPGRPGMPYHPVYPPYGYPPMSHHMFPGAHPGDARSRIPSQQPLFHPPSKRHLSEADALLSSKKRKVEDHSGSSSSSSRKSSHRRSGESSSHSRSSGHRERERHHRSSGEERVKGERRVESRSSHGERRSHRTVREEKRKSRKRSHSQSSDSSFEDDFGVRKEVLLHGTYDDYIKEYKSRSGGVSGGSSSKGQPSMADVAAAYQKALTQVASALQHQGSSSKMDSRTYSRRVEEFLEKMRNGQPVSSKSSKS